MKKLSFLELEKEMTTLNEAEMAETLGGNRGGDDPSWDCVLNCFDYLDDGVMNGYSDYYSGGLIITGTEDGSPVPGYVYNPQKVGGIRWQEFHQVGANGGLNVEEIYNPTIHENGLTDDGKHIMMTMPGANGKGHAVVITGLHEKNGKTYIDYYDPTTDENRDIENTEDNPIATGFYTVTAMNSTTSFPSTTVPSTTVPSTTMPSTTIV